MRDRGASRKGIGGAGRERLSNSIGKCPYTTNDGAIAANVSELDGERSWTGERRADKFCGRGGHGCGRGRLRPGAGLRQQQRRNEQKTENKSERKDTAQHGFSF